MSTARTDKELHQEFLKEVKDSHWRPTDPQPAPTRETLKRDLREHLVQKLGSEALADLSISHLQSEADARAKLEALLREDLSRLDASIEAFRRETPKVLAPLEQRVRDAEALAAAAAEALKDARLARDSELARGLEGRRTEVLAKLRGVEVLQGRIVPWREGGTAPPIPGTWRETSAP